MDIALTGGTGFVGRALTRELLSRGHRLHLLVRPGSTKPSRPQAPPANTRTTEIDLADRDAVRRAIQGSEAVIHLVGIIHEIGADTFDRVHRELTSQLLGATADAEVRRFIHMSSLGTRPAARSRYHQTKWAAEECVRQSNLQWTIFRPSLICGDEDLFTRTLAKMARYFPVIPVLGPGTALMQPIAVEQVARAFAGALEVPASVGRTYDLCGPERLTFNQIVTAIISVLGLRRSIIHLPWWMARGQAVMLDALFSRLLHRAPPFNPDQILMLQEDNIGSGIEADQTFRLEHLEFQTMIRRYLRPASTGSEESSRTRTGSV